ncbi:hypothetical protein C8R45DRAFT_386299 [Mycena sanguinolenta]|nr:hypothetical protein C8R45DRAFT_386299 [Mycena sanguinolenta]
MADAAAMPPAWFQEWDRTQFEPLERAVNDWESRFINSKCGSGHQAPFNILLFANGDNPTQQPHNLRALCNITVLLSLRTNTLNRYLNGYRLGTQGSRSDRQRRLAQHIGYYGNL